MKKYLSILMIAFVVPTGVFADGLQEKTITTKQKSAFASRAHITKNDFAVPTLIDVPVSFDRDALQEAIVVDAGENIVPSIIVSNATDVPLVFTTKNSFGDNSHAIVDGDHETYKEFPFVEDYTVEERIISVTDGYDNESRLQEKDSIISGENSVTIDIQSNRAFKTDSFTLYFDDHITKPTHVRVVAVNEIDEEKILLPEKFFTQNTIVFPEGNTDHYRVTLRYIKPLRINEIVFHETDMSKAMQYLVRFIAGPQMPYDIYFDTYEHVKINHDEQPNFSAKQNVPVVMSEYIKDNLLYKKGDSDDDGILDGADNCVNIKNPDQIDKDENGVGDACEDFDRDGVINAKDNCLQVANRSQVDVDIDGVGDACDDEESRFMEKNSWIAYIAIIFVFIIVITLTVKTLKKE